MCSKKEEEGQHKGYFEKLICLLKQDTVSEF